MFLTALDSFTKGIHDGKDWRVLVRLYENPVVIVVLVNLAHKGPMKLAVLSIRQDAIVMVVVHEDVFQRKGKMSGMDVANPCRNPN